MITIETLQADLDNLRSDWKQSCQLALAAYDQTAECDLPGYAEYREAEAVIEEKIEGLQFKQRQAEREKAKAWRDPEAVAKMKEKADAALKDAERGLRIWSFPSLEEACILLPRHVESFARRSYSGARERNVRVITIFNDGEVWRSVDEAPEQPKPKAKALFFGD